MFLLKQNKPAEAHKKTNRGPARARNVLSNDSIQLYCGNLMRCITAIHQRSGAVKTSHDTSTFLHHYKRSHALSDVTHTNRCHMSVWSRTEMLIIQQSLNKHTHTHIQRIHRSKLHRVHLE